jgi:polyisoprenoid-binding protein YceI
MRHTLFAALSLVALASPGFAAEPYAFDPSHTSISYSIDHMGLSEMHGVFRKFDGELQLDVKDLAKSSVSVTIDVASIDTGVDKLDEHLRTPDFFDVGKFPQIAFKSTKVEPTGANSFKLTGDLTLHGVTKSVTLNASMRTVDSHPFRKVPAAGFLATGEIKRSEFGITTYPGALGEVVKIRIDTETAQNLPAPAPAAAAEAKK